MPFICGGFLETIGYAIRIYSGLNVDEVILYVLQLVFLLLAPALFAASIYMVFGRLVRVLDAEQHSIVKLKWFTRLFVFGDVGSFLVQGTGGGLVDSNQKLEEIITIVGLILQIIFFGAFMVVMSIFQYRISKNPTLKAVSYRNHPSSFRNWYMIMITLFMTSGLIFIRSIVRCVEFCQGSNGYIMVHEVFLYVLDAQHMILVMILFIFQDMGKFFDEMRHQDLKADVLMEGHILEDCAKI